MKSMWCLDKCGKCIVSSNGFPRTLRMLKHVFDPTLHILHLSAFSVHVQHFLKPLEKYKTMKEPALKQPLFMLYIGSFVKRPNDLFSVFILMERIVEWQFTWEKIICFHCKWKKEMHVLRETLQSVVTLLDYSVSLQYVATERIKWETSVICFSTLMLTGIYSHVKPW